MWSNSNEIHMVIQQITLHAEQLFTFSTAHVMSYLQIKPYTNNIQNMSKSFFLNVYIEATKPHENIYHSFLLE